MRPHAHSLLLLLLLLLLLPLATAAEAKEETEETAKKEETEETSKKEETAKKEETEAAKKEETGKKEEEETGKKKEEEEEETGKKEEGEEETGKEPKESAEAEEQFTESQKAVARQRLSELFDSQLDADGDGKLSRRELLRRMSELADASILDDVNRKWSALNATGERLSWDAWAASRVPSRMAQAAADADAAESVRRAIDAAKKETGAERLGLKVGVPQAPAATSEADGQALANELNRDRRRWEAADADGDGQLSRQEFRDFMFPDDAPRMRGTITQETMEKLDENDDGKLSLREFLSDPEDAGDAVKKSTARDDTEGKRKVAAAAKCEGKGEGEGKAACADSGAAKYSEEANAKEAKGEGEGEGEGDESDPKAFDKKEFAKNDKNGDGVLDLEELQGALFSDDKEAEAEAKDEMYSDEGEELLRQADADGDGEISKQEALDSVELFATSPVTNYGDSLGIHEAA